jgi:hypothetical protein
VIEAATAKYMREAERREVFHATPSRDRSDVNVDFATSGLEVKDGIKSGARSTKVGKGNDEDMRDRGVEGR